MSETSVACKGPQAYIEMQTPVAELWCSTRARKKGRKPLKGVTRAIKGGVGLTTAFEEELLRSESNMQVS